jgi:hypothetical protein
VSVQTAAVGKAAPETSKAHESSFHCGTYHEKPVDDLRVSGQGKPIKANRPKERDAKPLAWSLKEGHGSRVAGKQTRFVCLFLSPLLTSSLSSPE